MASPKCTMVVDGAVCKIKSINMKERILTGWTFTRVLYILLGGFLIIQSAMIKQWPGIIFGGYFASMGLFAFGCAAGNCFSGNCQVGTKQRSNNTIRESEPEKPKSTYP